MDMYPGDPKTLPPDPRDDYRNGFLDAVAYLRGQQRPTSSQVGEALEILGCFRREKQPTHQLYKSATCSLSYVTRLG